jgi:hypothetical protein
VHAGRSAKKQTKKTKQDEKKRKHQLAKKHSPGDVSVSACRVGQRASDVNVYNAKEFECKCVNNQSHALSPDDVSVNTCKMGIDPATTTRETKKLTLGRKDKGNAKKQT